MSTITLTLTEQTMEFAQQAAVVLQRPVEEVLSDLLTAVLPAVHDAPADLQAELMRMTWFESQELWRLARSQMSTEKQEQMQQLSHLQEQRILTVKEQQQLDILRNDNRIPMGAIRLVKACGLSSIGPFRLFIVIYVGGIKRVAVGQVIRSFLSDDDLLSLPHFFYPMFVSPCKETVPVAI